jgi:2-polyprenyl-3-methyl-5-hydroxy-6-metoxy-1,4-benzoquinol methylase
LLATGWPLAYRVEDVNGFNSLQTRRYTDYLFSQKTEDVSYGMLSNPKRLAENDPIFNSLNVKYVFIPTGRQPQIGKHLQLVYENEFARVYLNTTCWPRVFFPDSVRVELDPQEILERVTATGYDARKETYVEDREFVAPVRGGAARATVVRRSNDRIEVKTTTDSHRLLVLSEIYAPGWKAYIDGAKAPVFRVNYLFRGVTVPPGQHTVRFAYRPASLTIGSLISLASWFGIVAVLWSTRRPNLAASLGPERTVDPAEAAGSRPDRERVSQLIAAAPPAALPTENLLKDEPISGSSSQPNRYTLSRDRDSSHRRIAGLILALKRSPILDVGAAQGVLGQLIAGAGLVVDAVEPDLATGIEANSHYRTIYACFAEDAPLPDAAYSAVVCADVLEHTVDPVVVLRRLCRAAAADALFLVSLPNVGHASARPFTFFGWFPKMARGIFDRTHRHFYTRETAAAMLRAGGLEVLHAFPTPMPLEKVWPAWLPRFGLGWLMGLQRLAIGCLPGLFAYQWVFVAASVGDGRFVGNASRP